MKDASDIFGSGNGYIRSARMVPTPSQGHNQTLEQEVTEETEAERVVSVLSVASGEVRDLKIVANVRKSHDEGVTIGSFRRWSRPFFWPQKSAKGTKITPSFFAPFVPFCGYPGSEVPRPRDFGPEPRCEKCGLAPLVVRQKVARWVGWVPMILGMSVSLNAADNNWGKWGSSDEKGTLNYITPEVIRAAAATPKRGAVFSLALPITTGQVGSKRAPHLFVTKTGQNAGPQPGSLSEVLLLPTQGTTHWNGLAHVFGDGVIYNGYDAEASVTPAGAQKNGIGNAAGRVVSRGVLLDVARVKDVQHLEAGYAISRADLDETARRQGIVVRPGDIVLIRTGWITLYDPREPEKFRGAQPGLGWEAARWLKEIRAAAVAVDNLNAEVSPADRQAARAIGHPEFAQPVTYELIRNQGMLVGQMFSLEALAADCARDGVFEFFFAASPLRFVNGVSCPINPIAVK